MRRPGIARKRRQTTEEERTPPLPNAMWIANPVRNLAKRKATLGNGLKLAFWA